jgi:hypothetical protein
MAGRSFGDFDAVEAIPSHPSYSKSFLAYIGLFFVRLSIKTYFERKQVKKEVVSRRLTEDLRSTLVLVIQFCDISSIPKQHCTSIFLNT